MLNDNFTATERNALEGEGWGREVEVGVNNPYVYFQEKTVGLIFYLSL